MLAIYKIEVDKYGTYVSSSETPNEAIELQMMFLKVGTHHNALLQHLYNLFPDSFSTEIVMYVPDKPLLNLLKQMYRSSLQCCLDSPYRCVILDNRYMLHKFSRPFFVQVDEYQIARVYDKNERFISYEVAPEGFVSGWYDIISNLRLGRIKRDPILGL